MILENSLQAAPITDVSELGLDWWLLAPVLTLLVGAVLGLLIEALVKPAARYLAQSIWTPLVIVLSLLMLVPSLQVQNLSAGQLLVRGDLIFDGLTLASQVVLLVIGLLAILPMMDRTALKQSTFVGQASDTPGSYREELTERKGYQRSEFFPLTLFSLGGMLLFPMANSFITLFVALEIISLPLYIMTAMSRYRRLLSQEAALKYFIMGAFASAFFLMGCTLLYGYSGTLILSEVANYIPYGNGPTMLLLVGSAMVLVGLLFKVGAAPFHAWTPDVYQGAPTPVTGFMAAGVKASAFLVLLRFFSDVLVQNNQLFKPVLWAVAILTMIVGTFLGLVQNNVKRMLAYSSIAHAGFILIAFVPMSIMINASVLFYVLVYGIATVGAFGVISLVRRANSEGKPLSEQHDLAGWAGLGKTNPMLAVCMMLFLLSFAGIPLTAGFMGKFMLFSAGVQGGNTGLVIAAVISSAITAFYYFRLAKIMFVDQPAEDTVVVKGGKLTMIAIFVAAVLVVLLGVFPEPVVHLLEQTLVVLPA